MVLLLSGFSGGDCVVVENVEQAYLVGVVFFTAARHVGCPFKIGFIFILKGCAHYSAGGLHF